MYDLCNITILRTNISINHPNCPDYLNKLLLFKQLMKILPVVKRTMNPHENGIN